MTRRDLLFAALLIGGAGTLASTLTPPRIRPSAASPIPLAAPQPIIAAVDQALAASWRAQGVTPAPPASELVVLRRLALALTGAIPGLAEIRRFEALPHDRRLARWLDDRLSDRRTSDYLAERLARGLVGTEDGPFLVYRRRRLVAWLSDELQRNRPYDAVVRDLIAAEGLWTTHPPTNFISVTFDPTRQAYDPERLAARVARAFLGVRIDCAQCHDHPFQPWKQTDFRGLAAFFGQVQPSFTGIRDGAGEFHADPPGGGRAAVVEPRVPFRSELDPQVGSRRERLARWVTAPGNSHFSRATTNRAWALLFGRPLVEPIDDLAAEADPPAILGLLADNFAARGFDLRDLLRTIASTRAFAIDSATGVEAEASATAEAAWAAFPISRLRPEQVAGATTQAASTATIDSRSPILWRLTTAGAIQEFVSRHGDPGEDEFNLATTSTIPQRLLLMNGDLVQQTIREDLGNTSGRIAALAPDDRTAVEAAYLAALTRRPTAAESAHFQARLAGTRGEARQQGVTDLLWVLVNSTEFSYNH